MLQVAEGKLEAHEYLNALKAGELQESAKYSERFAKYKARYTFPEEEKYEDLEYAEKAYGIFVDALKNGATTRGCIFATRHRYATELLMKLMEESGLVSYVGKVNMDREASEALTEDSAEISAYTTFGWINAVKDKFKNTKPILTPRFIPCCTDKLMEELREIQMAYGIPVQSHLSESRGEIDFVKFLRPKNSFYGDSYNEYDLFGKNDDIGVDVKTVMAFGGEPLLYPDTVCAIHTAATELGIEKRQLITNGFFSKDEYVIKKVAEGVVSSGANDILLSVDAFHQETIPLDVVKVFAKEVKNFGVPIRLQPAWLVNPEHDNPYTLLPSRSCKPP